MYNRDTTTLTMPGNKAGLEHSQHSILLCCKLLLYQDIEINLYQDHYPSSELAGKYVEVWLRGEEIISCFNALGVFQSQTLV